MTTAEKLEYLTSISSDEKDQSVLSDYLSMAEDIAYARVFPFGVNDEEKAGKIMHRYDRIICEIAVYLVNKRGAEARKPITRQLPNASMRTAVSRIPS